MSDDPQTPVSITPLDEQLLRPGHNRASAPVLDALHDLNSSPELVHAAIVMSVGNVQKAVGLIEGHGGLLGISIGIAKLCREARKAKRDVVLAKLPTDLQAQIKEHGSAILPEHFTRDLKLAASDDGNHTARSRVKGIAEWLLTKHESDDDAWLSVVSTLKTMTHARTLRSDEHKKTKPKPHQTIAKEQKLKARFAFIGQTNLAQVIFDPKASVTLPAGGEPALLLGTVSENGSVTINAVIRASEYDTPEQYVAAVDQVGKRAIGDEKKQRLAEKEGQRILSERERDERQAAYDAQSADAKKKLEENQEEIERLREETDRINAKNRKTWEEFRERLREAERMFRGQDPKKAAEQAARDLANLPANAPQLERAKLEYRDAIAAYKAWDRGDQNTRRRLRTNMLNAQKRLNQIEFGTNEGEVV